MKRMKCTVILLAIILVLTGCGREGRTAEEVPILNYIVKEIRLRNPDRLIEGEPDYVMEYDCKLVGGTLYRLAGAIWEEEGKARWYLQTIEAPFETWDMVQLDLRINLAEEAYIIGEGLTDAGLAYVALRNDGGEESFAILQDGTWSVVEALPTAEEEESVFTADTQAVFRRDGDQSEKLFSWSSYGIYLREALTLWAESEEHMILLGYNAKGRVLLQIDKREVQQTGERQQITIAAFMTPFLQKAIQEFNIVSDAYVVVARDCSEESYEEMSLRFQAELTAGKGPDLIDSRFFPIYSYAQNGCLEPLEDWLSQYNLLSQAVHSCEVEGHCYVAPYRFNLHSLVSTAEITEGRSSWTLEEMLEIMSTRPAETFYEGARDWDALYCMLCYDEENPTFVDWENETCHFETEEFVELLECTKEWGDDQCRSAYYETEWDRFRKGHVMAFPAYPDCQLDSYYGYLNCLEDSCVYIGFPVENGNGTFVEGIGFAINRASECKEGARAFLEYLISPEKQLENWEEDGVLPVDTEVMGQIMRVYAREGLPYKNDWDVVSSSDRDYDEEEAEQFYQLILNSKPKGMRYQEILDIIFEETSSYYEGNRDPWEVARVLQNRVQMYLDEHKK